MDIVEFLRARLDEDEAVAGEAVAIRDQAYGTNVRVSSKITAWSDHPTGVVIADPERVAVEVEAKRVAIDWYENDDDITMAATVMALAAIYADHPDYDPEWR